MLIMTIVSSNLNWGENQWQGIIEADGKGYYAYLPAIFIYKDLNYGFFDEIEKEKYYHENLYYDYRASVDGKVINKYYCGTAIAELPFFLLAHALSYVAGLDTDGYSRLYPILINIAALFYLWVGLLFLNSTLRIYGLNPWQVSLVLFAAVFGTNLFYYTVGEPGMSHVYSFGFVAMFFYFSKQFFSSLQKEYILAMAVSLGFITLIRPVNGLIVFILPFAAGSFHALKQGVSALFRQRSFLAFGILSFGAIVCIQLIIYKLSTGRFFIYTYGEEGFNFLSPHIVDILFSYKKGLFLYTPLYLISLLGGCVYFWRHSRYELFTWLGFFLLITYVFSSWWMWYYGGSFSSRVYVEYIPLFMVLLGLTLKDITSKLAYRFFSFFIFLLIVVCQIQTYQYRYYQIHWVDMTKEKYWDVFMRIDKLIK